MLGLRGEKNCYQTVNIKNFKRGAGRMDDDWKEFISKEVEESLDKVMAEIEADPKMKDVKSPEEMYDNIVAMINEYERQKVYEQLSDEDKELIQLGKVYKKKRGFDKFVVALAAVIVGLGIGSVCMGDGENPLVIITRMLNERKQTGVDSGNTDPEVCDKEAQVYERIEEAYGFSPVKLEYLPEGIAFHEAIFGNELQGVNMFYMTGDKVNITYIIRPNFRESSLGTDIEDDKRQEYLMYVNDVEIKIQEFFIAESEENRWSIDFEYQNVQYLLRVNNMKQEQVEKIVNNLYF